MRPPDAETGPSGKAPFQKSPEETTNNTKATTRPRQEPITQQERVRRMLNRGWVCGIEFLDPPDGGAPILRYSAHFHSLRRDLWLIDRRECEHPWHNHTQSTMYQWKIVGHVDDGKLPMGVAG